MTQHESAHEDSEDRFYAQFDSREVELMTLDELAAAFEEGRIHENTFVCREGDSEWCTLADVAGLGEEEEAPLAAPVVETRPPMPARRPELAAQVGESRPPMPARQPEPVAVGTRPPMPARRPDMDTVPAQRFQQSVAPIAQQSSPALSYAPVTSNIDDSSLDMDELSLRPKRRWGLVAAAAGVLALAGGGTVFALGNSSALASAIPNSAALEAAASHSQASLSLSNIQTKPSEPAAPAVPSAPEPVAAVAPTPAADAPSDAPKAAAPAFSDDMKAALLAADKTRTDKHAKKVKASSAKSAGAPRRSKAAASGGFKSGGSAYDPLNGKL